MSDPATQQFKIPASTPADCVPSYLTIGKVYEATHRIGTALGLYQLINNEGREITISSTACAHIGGHSWEEVLPRDKHSPRIVQAIGPKLRLLTLCAVLDKIRATLRLS